MRPGIRPRVAGVLVVIFGSFGCGGDTGGRVPTAEDLAGALVEPGDLAGDWTVLVAPDGTVASGVVTDDQQQLLPRIEFCDAAGAASRAAAATVRWDAFAQLDLDVDDPIEAPDRRGHLVFVQEFLLADRPDRVESRFDAFRDGFAACLGEIAADLEGPGVATAMEVPAVGDDRYGVLTTIHEAGGVDAEWRLHSTIVRVGAVLVGITVVEIRSGTGVEPLFDIAAVGEITTAAVAKL
ncbi:MAG TPA: hypothetical protein VIS05_04535 [Ilumatobacter sp.]